jgi:hypothetical protein
VYESLPEIDSSTRNPLIRKVTSFNAKGSDFTNKRLSFGGIREGIGLGRG